MSHLIDFLNELTEESVVTRKMLQRVPVDKLEWRPHEKSMTIHQLAGHIAELPSWISMAFTTSGLDFEANPYSAPVWSTTEELLSIYENSFAGAINYLDKAEEKDLLPGWVLKSGSQTLLSTTKAGITRVALSQIIHHRAQLGVYLRLLDIPIPGSYGPSADEHTF